MSRKADTPIKSLEQQLRERFPEATISLDAPANRAGAWFLDLSHGGHSVVVQWRSVDGFGVSSSPNHGYGEGADEVYRDEEAAYGRVVSLLLSQNHTSPPASVRSP